MLEDLIVKFVVKQAMKALLAKIPFLSWGPLSLIASFFLEKLVRLMVEKTVLGLNFLYIDIKTEAQLAEYQKQMALIEEELLKGDYDVQKLDDMVAAAALKFYRIG